MKLIGRSVGLSVVLGVLCASTAVAGATGKAPKEWGNKMNWQAWAKTITLPAMGSAADLTDGDTENVVRFCKGGESGAELKIAFPKPTEVGGLRFMQRAMMATHYQVYADMAGKGDFTELIADRTDEKAIAGEWIEIPIGKSIAGLRLVFVAGSVGYRSVYPNLAELEIYGKGGGGGVTRFGGNIVTTLEAKPLPAFDKRYVDIRICTDWWNYNMKGWEKQRKDGVKDLHEWDGYRNVICQLKELGVTSVRLFAESESCEKNGGFSSFPLEGLPEDQQRDWLRPLADALHRDGYPVYYFSHAWRAPIQRIGKQAEMPWCRWDYPYMASDALVGINEHYTESYPCVLSDDDFRTKWTDLLRGALKAGADGVYLCPDEYYYKGHNLSRCTCESCRRAFKKMFGYDELPKLSAPKVAQNAQGQVSAPLPVDTEHYRKYKLFEYRQLANVFDRVGADLRKEFPKAKLVMNENQGAVAAANGRLEHTIANDIFAESKNYDEKQVYGGGAMGGDRHMKHVAFAKHFIAACGTERMLSSAGWGPGNMEGPSEQFNGVIPEVFLGAPQLEIYRLNYIYESGGSSVWKKTLKMVHLLEQWGLKESSLPTGDVGFVYSRASEDWWYLKVTSMMDPSFNSGATDFNLNLADETINKVAKGSDNAERARILSQERMRGWGAQQTVESMLGANGFNYDVLYAERPDNMRDLKRFKTLVIPFGYSLSDAAVAEIKAAHATGTRLVIFEKLGETDEFGTPRKVPALKELVGKKGVTFVEESAADRSADLCRLWEYRVIVEKALGETGFTFNANGQYVTYLVRKLNDGKGWLLYLCNTANRNKMWSSTRDTTVTIGLPADGDGWKMETFSSDSCDLNANGCNGSTEFSAKVLKRFKVHLDPQEAKLIRIYR